MTFRRGRLLLLLAWAVTVSRLSASGVWVLQSKPDPRGAPASRSWAERLSAAGIPARALTSDELNPALQAITSYPQLLFIPDGSGISECDGPALEAFLARGNDVMVLDDFRSRKTTPQSAERPANPNATSNAQPIIEGLSPDYKKHLVMAHGVVRRDGAWLPFTGPILAALPRSPGFGQAPDRGRRQIPWAWAMDVSGARNGVAAHVLLEQVSASRTSIRGYVAAMVPESADSAVWTESLVLAMAKQIDRGLFLLRAGTSPFAGAAGDSVRLHATVLSRRAVDRDVSLTFTVMRDSQIVHSESFAVATPGREPEVRNLSGRNLELPVGEYTVITQLRQGEEDIDSLQQPLRIIARAQPTGTNRVTVHADGFRLDGQPWHPVGINYWPRYIAGLEANEFSDAAWSPTYYDPASIEADLAQMRSLGLSVMSLSYSTPEQAGPIIDLLARAQRHGLKANLYIPGLHPLQPDFPRAAALIRAAHLPGNPTVFAYDLGWEVRVGLRSERTRWDQVWHRWVIDQYGSIAAAVAEWGYAPPEENGFLVGATDDQLKQDGPWRTYVAAYRRFWDDTISRGYREVRAFIRSLDAHALLGARSGYGGTGAEWIAEHLPFDLASGAKHLDFISPEHYEDSSTEVEFMRSAFTSAYARLVSGGKPVFWSEFGRPVAWRIAPSDYPLEPAAAALQRQADYFRGVLDMVYRSGANGAAGWWWPGGYRVDEHSDFGVVGPDRGLRPAADALRQAAYRFIHPAPTFPIAGELRIDRDLYVTGYAGVYGAHSLDYAGALLAGAVPRLRTAGTGTNSANTPLVAIGNRPATSRNPPRFLNAEFNQITLNGMPVTDGATLDVTSGDPLVIAASVGNTAEASWLAEPVDTLGRVQLAVRWETGEALAPIAADTPFLADATVPPFTLPAALASPVELRFRMTAQGRAEFGETVRITVQARPPREPRGGSANE